MKIKRMFLVGMIITVAACQPSSEQKEGMKTDSTKMDTASEMESQKSKPVASPRQQAVGQVSGVQIIVDYGSPGVKDRKIWGDLVKYGKVWRAGANETTSLEFSEDVTIGEKTITAGKYGFYLIPMEGGNHWVAIINTDWDREKHEAWGATNYTQEHDIVRINIPAQWSDSVQERLEYRVENDGIQMAWEKVRLLIPVAPVSAS